MAKKLITTPRGIASWPHLHAPDTKFDAAGVYSVKLEMPIADGQDIMDKMDAAIAERFIEAKKQAADAPKKNGKAQVAKLCEDKPYVINEEKGTVVFNFKLKASGETKAGEKFTQAPALFDIRGDKLPEGSRIGGGSTLRVSFEINPFYVPKIGCGVSARLKAVQVIDLKAFGANSDYFGFSDEGAESAEEMDTTNDNTATEDTSSDVTEEVAGLDDF